MLLLSLDSKPRRPILAYQDMLILPRLARSNFLLLLSRLAFLLSPSPCSGALSHACGSQMVPRAELSQATQPSNSPAALDKACEKRRCHTASPRAANRAGPRQPQEHQHSWVQVPLSPANRPEEETEVSFSRPGCSPTWLASLSPVLIRAPKLTDSEPKPILFQSDFVRALFAFKNLAPALSSYRQEKTTGVEVNPKGSPGRAAASGSCLYWLSVGFLSVSLYLPRTAGLSCRTSSHLALLFPHPPRICCFHQPSEPWGYF